MDNGDRPPTTDHRPFSSCIMHHASSIVNLLIILIPPPIEEYHYYGSTRTIPVRRMNHKYFARVAQILLQRNSISPTTTSRLSTTTTTTMAPAYPRAAVAATVQSQDLSTSVPHYLLVQRANPPDQGKWSLPGGKIELGETTLDAAQREITEETQLPAEDCQWLPYPFMTTDAIVYGTDDDDDSKQEVVAFHYLIAQCFARAPDGLPELTPSDDALDARWYTLQEIRDSLMADDRVSQGVLQVIQRAEELHDKEALL